MNLHRPSIVLTALAAIGLAGCASTDGSRDVGHYIVNVPQTPIFRYGPAQSFGPDFSLTQGQHVVMLRREFGYSRVMTDDGQSGYVATEDLAPAPPPPKVASNTARGNRGSKLPPTGTYRPGVSSANNRVLESGPLFQGELPPLPERDPEPSPAPPKKPEEKKEQPKPEFRYGKPKPGFRVNVPNPEHKP